MSLNTRRHFSFERRAKRSYFEMCSTNNVIYFFTIVISVVAAINGEPLTCYSCSSDSLEICATLNFGNSSRELPVEICSVEITSCFTKVSNGMTVRGCKTPAVECANGGAVGADGECSTCNSEKCNGNIFPEYRLHCLHCAGGNCVRPSNAVTVRYPCANYVESDSCYSIFSPDGQLAYRGCTSDNDTSEGKKFCNRNVDQCEKCASRGCNNNEVEWEKPLACIVCNSTEDEHCKAGTDGDRDACARTTAGYRNHCFTRVANHTVARGCLLGSNADTASDCNAWYSQTCTICRSDYCNQKPVADEYCFECSTSDDANCTSNVDLYMRKQCQSNFVENGCYRIIESDEKQLIRRGCASELNETDVVTCHIEAQRYCKLCSGSDCNRKPEPQKCYICNSAIDPGCTSNVTALMTTECTHYVDQCITLIDSLHNDTIVRDCLQHVFKDDTFCRNNPALCSACEGDNCNSAPLADNHTCYTCDSVNDPNCHRNLNNSMITQCTLSVHNMGCYHSINETDSTVRRGCVSDLTPLELSKCDANQTACKICDGPNCNKKNGFQQCYSCKSTEDVDCIRATQWFTPVTCKAYNDECYVHVANDVVTRGCLLESHVPDVEDDCSDRDICEKCMGDVGCNNKIVDGEFCMTCDSTVDPNCRTNLTFALRTQCSLAVTPLGCYRFEDENDLVKRGCLSDIRPDERQMCRRQGNDCKTCLGDDCNTRISFRTCHVCNSTASVNCIRAPSIFPVVTCTDYLDECYTRVKNDVVDRGCLRQAAPSNEGLVKDCEDKDVCAKCLDKARCNNRVVDGEFCMTCDSTRDPNCRANVTFQMRKQCALSVTKMGCYRFEDEDDVVKRGCLSDIRPDERQMCRREEENCKTCTGDDCNAKISFQQCHVCNSTQSVNCIRVPSIFPVVTCRNYLDECFTHVRNNSVARGCVLQSNSGAIDLDCQGKKVKTDYCDRCKEGQCNHRTVEGEFCLTCDSDVNTNCRTNLTYQMRTQCALAVRPLGCYRFEDEFDVVKRGCLSDVRDDERKMCREEGSDCKTCVGDDCNRKVAFQRCVACRSVGNDTICETNATSYDNTLCKNYLDNCFTHVRNNVTTRGCLLEQKNDLVGVDFQRECADPDLCQKCENLDSCNVAPIASETCGVQEAPGNPFRPIQCPKAVIQLGCYRAFDKFTGVSTRGCVSQLPPPQRKLCHEEGDTCKTCKSTAAGQVCNALDSFTRCYGCDSSSNPNCAVNPTDGMIVTCASYNDTCFTSLSSSNDQVRRGCLNDMNSQFISSCRTNDRNCEICLDGHGACNNRSVGIERCIECDSKADPNCIDRLYLFGEGKVCNANKPLRWQGCYLSMEDGHVRRGCVSDIVDPAQAKSCHDGKENCKVCNGRNCNRKEQFQTCYDCDSHTFEQCSQVNASATVVCRDYMDTCVVSLRPDGSMRRGCSDQFTPSELAADSQFRRCPGGNCNGHVFPEDRQLCHRCNGGEYCQYLENATNATTLHPCPRYTKNDECFSLLRMHNRMYRGCKSDSTESQAECQMHKDRCKMCEGNGCNAHDRTRKPTLSCAYCNGTDECSFGQLPMSMIVAPCRNKVLFQKTETCFIDRTANGVRRGCTLDMDDNDRWCKATGNCTLCEENKCNRENAYPQLCHECHGAECGAAQNQSTSVVCPGIFGRPRAGCYTNVKDDASVSRGCFNDLSDEQMHDCHTRKQCSWCLPNNCNHQYSSAFMATISPVLLVLSIVFAQIMTK